VVHSNIAADMAEDAEVDKCLGGGRKITFFVRSTVIVLKTEFISMRLK